MKRRKPLRRVSAKQAARLKCYRLLRDAYMKLHPICEFPLCDERSQDLHHVAGRGLNLLNDDTWLALCRKHHRWIHDHPGQARMAGLHV
jgi:hypothetical protein